jgi:hypothetical protein
MGQELRDTGDGGNCRSRPIVGGVEFRKNCSWRSGVRVGTRNPLRSLGHWLVSEDWRAKVRLILETDFLANAMNAPLPPPSTIPPHRGREAPPHRPSHCLPDNYPLNGRKPIEMGGSRQKHGRSTGLRAVDSQAYPSDATWMAIPPTAGKQRCWRSYHKRNIMSCLPPRIAARH